MNCPRCENNRVDLLGKCLVCGYEVSQLEEEPAQGLEPIFPKEETDQNLQNIIDTVVSSKTSSLSLPESDEAPSILSPKEFFLQELQETEADEDRPATGSFVFTEADASDASDVSDVAYTQYAAYEPDAESVANDEEASEEDAGVVETGIFTYAANTSDSEGRMIFLSRTLAGIIDLFLVALFSGIFLGLADYFTNAPMLSSINAVNFTALSLMIYFLYSIFFLGTNSQTIGMMAADLRVAGMDKNNFSISRVVCRSAAFLVSLLIFGIGLLAGFFSQNYMCLHDRLSGTRVIRT